MMEEGGGRRKGEGRGELRVFDIYKNKIHTYTHARTY